MNIDVDDDGLPVLTQVLRTGHVERPLPAASNDVVAVVGHDEAPGEEDLQVDPLVIGYEPHVGVEAYLAPVPGHGMPTEDIAPARDDGPHDAARPDAFGLSQDVDAQRGDGRPATIDEPHIATGETRGAPAAPDERRLQDPSEIARRVRDAVLDGLGARIDTELDARIAQAIHAEVEAAFAQLQVQLRAHLAAALRDVVGRAVDEEIALSLGSPPVDRHD